MDNFKNWYTERKGKYILFFGFYLIFFIVVSIYLRSIEAKKTPKDDKKEASIEEKITTYDISKLINNDYSYEIEIIDNEEIISFSGTKSNIDYANYENKYFLDIYNINQLLKRSDFVDSKNHILEYKLANKEINDILLTNKSDNTNKIEVYVNDKTEVEKIVLDLTNYLEKNKYQITIIYTVGDENETSSS